MPTRRRSYNRRRSNRNGSGCSTLIALIPVLVFIFEIIIKATVALVKLLYEVSVRVYQYLRANPAAQRFVFVAIILVLACASCVRTVNFISGLIPTATPTITFTPTLTATATATLLPTITLTPTITFTPTITPTPKNTATLTPTRTNTPKPPDKGFILIYIDETAFVRGVATATIQTQPNAQCTLTFILPSGRESTVAGVGTHTADKDGFCTWWWEIKFNVNPGRGAVVITAGGQTEIYGIKIEE